MKRLFAIVLCLIVTGSALGGTLHPKGRSEIKTAKVVLANVVQLVQWRIGIVPTGDGLTPPWPKPGGKTTCCK